MLTDQERQRIYEEEAARRQVPPHYTPTDWLASCILVPMIIGAGIIGMIVLLIFGLVIKGLFWPVY